MSDAFPIQCPPGFARDGTRLDADSYIDGEWVRFDRGGRPRKIGGYRAMTTKVAGPTRGLLVDSRGGINSVHAFSQWGVARLEFDTTGAGGGLQHRTPASFTPDPAYTWSYGVMASSTGGSYAALLAAATPDLNALDADAVGSVYYGDIRGTDPLVQLADEDGPLEVSGGVTVLGPIAVIYGSDGLIRNSKPNDLTPTGWTAGGGSLANSANPVGSKVVYGAPVRGGGQSPAGLFWSLDALIRMSLSSDATTIFNYDVLSQPTSILGKRCVVEHDGQFFWVGSDRFLMYNGVVQEVPNGQNLNWFFDNINMAARNKVWGTKIPRWGEIWWFFPFGTSTECDAAIIYNYRQKVWYDARKVRSAGGSVQVFPFPVWAGAEDAEQTQVLTVGYSHVLSTDATAGDDTLTLTSASGVTSGQRVRGPGIAPGTTVSGVLGADVTLSADLTADVAAGASFSFSQMSAPFQAGETLTGDTSGAQGTVAYVQETQVNLVGVTGTFDPAGEALVGSLGGAADSIAVEPFTQQLESIYQQEFGLDKVVGERATALRSSFSLKEFGYAIGTPFGEAPKVAEVATRVIRVTPDFIQRGPMTVTAVGRDFPREEPRELASGTYQEGDSFVDLRGAQARLLSLTFASDVLGGNYVQGVTSVSLGVGDQRSGVPT